MLVIKSVTSLRSKLKQYKKQNKSIGFVPTMGALHDGHLSLIKKAREQNDIVVISIYVNPTQFSPSEDLKQYPRPLKQDKVLAEACGVNILFLPDDQTMYGKSPLTTVTVDQLTKTMEGKSRPTHFAGVTTIVAKLMNIVQPDKIYFGQKDAQQVIVIKKMAQDLHFDTKIVVCPIIREKDGLALSSRNTYLNDNHRRESVILYQSLKLARQKIKNGEKKSKIIVDFIRENILNHSHGKIDYIACVDAELLKDIKTLHGKVLIALAVKFGTTRLIDNIIVEVQ